MPGQQNMGPQPSNPSQDSEAESFDQFIEDGMNNVHESFKGQARDNLNELFAHVSRGKEAFLAAYEEYIKKHSGEDEGGS